MLCGPQRVIRNANAWPPASCGGGRRCLLIFHPLSTEMPLFWSHQGCGLQHIEGCNLSPNDPPSSCVASASGHCTGRRTTELLPSTIGRKSCKPQDFPIEISAAAAPKAAATLWVPVPAQPPLLATLLRQKSLDLRPQPLPFSQPAF